MRRDELIYKLGRRIAKLRSAKKINQFDFADMAGKSANTISNIERGITDPKVSTLEVIARALDTDIATLFSDAEKIPLGRTPLFDEVVKLLQDKDEKTMKAVLQQIQILLSMKN